MNQCGFSPEEEGGRGEVAQILYIHVSKCKKHKIKKVNKQEKEFAFILYILFVCFLT
jgi:hypothetical protein